MLLPSAELDLVPRYTSSKLEESHRLQHTLMKKKRSREVGILSAPPQPFLSVGMPLSTWSFATQELFILCTIRYCLCGWTDGKKYEVMLTGAEPCHLELGFIPGKR